MRSSSAQTTFHKPAAVQRGVTPGRSEGRRASESKGQLLRFTTLPAFDRHRLGAEDHVAENVGLGCPCRKLNPASKRSRIG